MKNQRRKKQPIKLTLDDYFEKVSSQPKKYSVLPKPLVADKFNKSQAWVSKQVSDGVFEVIEISNNNETKCLGKLVSMRSVLKYQELAEKDNDKLIGDIKRILVRSAKKGVTIPYSDLMHKVGMDSKIPNDRSRIGKSLGELSEETYDNQGIMLSALAVLKNTGLPNESFFVLARELGHESYDDDDEEFLATEIKKISALAKKGKIK